MRVRLSIGDFSRMTHLSVKALRHYHDVGLLEPVEIDSVSGYRYYEPGQVPVAQVIRRFRDLGMPLDRVKAVLEAPDVATRSKAILAHLEGMEAELARTQATVAGLQALLEGPPRRLPVEFGDIPATDAVAIREVVDVKDFVPWWVGAFEELYETVAGAGGGPSGPGGALYPGEFFQLDRAEVTAFVPVASQVGSSGRTGRVEPVQIPGGEFAVAVHEGPLEEIDRTYGALGTVVAERAVGVEGPIREHYLVGFRQTQDQQQHRTEVCWPVFQVAP